MRSVSGERVAVDHGAGGGAPDIRLPADHCAPEPATARAGAGAHEPQAGLPDHAEQQAASGAEPYRAPGSHPRRQGHRDVLEPAWCSDGFEFTCWNGDVVVGAFIIDTCPGGHRLACGGQCRDQWLGRARHDARGGREAVWRLSGSPSDRDAQRQRLGLHRPRNTHLRPPARPEALLQTRRATASRGSS